MLKKLSASWPLLSILMVAFSLRAIGLNFGLPYIYSDEPIFVVHATQMMSSGDLNPHWFGHPAHILIYVLLLWFSAISACFGLSWFLTGKVRSLAELGSVFTPDFYRMELRPTYYFWGRFLIVLMALAAIVLTYRIGKKLYSRNAGLLAALCLALSPMFIQYSRVIRTDMPSVLCVMVSTYFLLKYIAENKEKWLIFSALFVGFAASNKYTAGVAVFPPALAALCLGDRRPSELLKVLFYSALGFFISSPFVILDFKHALVDIIAETEPTHLGADRLDGLQTHVWYLKDVLRSAIGGLYFHGFALAGLVVLMRRRSLMDRLFSAFPAVYLFAMGLGHLRFERWMLPIIPFEAVCFGVGLCSVWKALDIQRSLLKRVGLALIVSGLCFFVIRNFGLELKNGLKLRRTDTRTMAKDWAERELPQGSKIAYEDYAPQFEELPKADFVLMNMGWDQIVSQPLSYYAKSGVDYIVITDSIWVRYYREKNKYPVQIARYEELRREAELIKRFRSAEHPGPTIEVYRLRRSRP